MIYNIKLIDLDVYLEQMGEVYGQSSEKLDLD